MRAFVKLNLKIAKLSKHKSNLYKVKVLAINPDCLQMKPARPPEGAGLIDQKLLNQACLKHHISIGTVFDPLNRCVLCERNTNFVLDPGRQNKLHNLQLRTFLWSSLCVNWQMFDYEIITEAPLFHTEVMLFNKLPLVKLTLVNALTNIRNTFVTVFIHLC